MMGAMTATAFPAGSGPLTVRDLEGMPDDGRRYELIDGVLIVSPAPGTRHQAIVSRLGWALDAAATPDYGVLVAPYAVRHGDSIELQPDVLVGRLADFTAKDLPHPPVLVVEVLSPSTAIIDLNTKKAVYERLGVASYWVIDPMELELTVFELRGGRYVEIVRVTDGEPFDATQPYPVRIVLTDLLGPFGHPAS